MNNKEIQTIRMMTYFIDATSKIIEEEGVDHVTIRGVAENAGYNSATIYNYFGELSHLIYFASMKFLKKYTNAIPHYVSGGEDPLEKYLLLWECFCNYSFQEPHIYNAIFISDLGVQPADLFKEYYHIFPMDLIDLPEDFKPMIIESSLSLRERIALKKCVEAEYIKKENAEKINEMNVLIWQGMITKILNNRSMYSAEEACQITMDYIKQVTLNANQFQFN